jgi:hypothetical protein
MKSSKPPRIQDVMTTDTMLTVSYDDGRIISLPLRWFPRLERATPSQRRNWEIIGGGYGVHWPKVDEDLSAEGLLAGRPARDYLRRQAGRVARRRENIAA